MSEFSYVPAAPGWFALLPPEAETSTAANSSPKQQPIIAWQIETSTRHARPVILCWQGDVALEGHAICDPTGRVYDAEGRQWLSVAVYHNALTAGQTLRSKPTIVVQPQYPAA